jgi:hypothetical protein
MEGFGNAYIILIAGMLGNNPLRKRRRIWQYGIRIKDVCGEGSYAVMLSDLVILSA